MFPILLPLFVSRNQQNAVTLENLALVGIWTDGVLIVHIVVVEIIKLTPYISIIIVEIIRRKKNQRKPKGRRTKTQNTTRHDQFNPPLANEESFARLTQHSRYTDFGPFHLH